MRGKLNAKLNIAILSGTIIGLSIYFTVKSSWNVGTIAVIVILALMTGFYVWLWNAYFRDKKNKK